MWYIGPLYRRVACGVMMYMPTLLLVSRVGQFWFDSCHTRTCKSPRSPSSYLLFLVLRLFSRSQRYPPAAIHVSSPVLHVPPLLSSRGHRTAWCTTTTWSPTWRCAATAGSASARKGRAPAPTSTPPRWVYACPHVSTCFVFGLLI